MMEQKHLLQQAQLELEFDHSTMAWQFEQQASHYINQRLLPLVDQIFDQLCPDGQVLSIDELQLDLGVIVSGLSLDNFYQRLERRLDEVIRQQLLPLLRQQDSKHLVATSDGMAHHVSGLTQLSSSQSQWQLLRHFLLFGRLPWQAQKRFQLSAALTKLRGAYLQPLLGLLLQMSAKGVESGSQTRQLLSRLDKQLPTEQWMILLTQLVWALESQTSGHKTRVLGQLFAEVLTQLAGRLDRQQQAQAEQLLARLTPTRENQIASESLDSAELQQILTQALLAGRYRPLQQLWSKMMSQPGMLAETVRYHGRRIQVRRTIVATFSELMFGDTLRVLEPGAHEFISQLLHQPKWFQQALDKTAKASIEPTLDQLKQRLWLFTLSYLLLERGSEFNRQNYLGSLIKQQAQHHNLEPLQLLLELASVVMHMPTNSLLHQQLQQLLSRLIQQYQPKDKALINPQTQQLELSQLNQTSEVVDEPELNLSLSNTQQQAQQLRKVLEDALLHGKIKHLSGLWQQLLVHKKHWLRAGLLDLGRLVIARVRISHHFERVMRDDVFRLLVPGQCHFIFEMLKLGSTLQRAINSSTHSAEQQQPLLGPESRSERQSLNKLIGQQGISEQQLAFFSLTYILVDRGSYFNRQNYMHSVIAQLAAHHNLATNELLVSMAAVLNRLKDPTGVVGALQQLVNQLLVQLPERVTEAAQEQADNQDSEILSQQDIDELIGRFGMREQLETYQLYDQLHGLLLDSKNDKPLKNQSLGKSLRQLQEASKPLLLRLWRELLQGWQRNKALAAQLVAKLSPGQLLLLLETLLGLNGDAATRPGGLVDTIKVNVAKISDKSRYFSRLFTALFEQRGFDFEQLNLGMISGSTTAPSERETQVKLATQTQQPDLSLAQSSEAILLERLNRDQESLESLTKVILLGLRRFLLAKPTPQDLSWAQKTLWCRWIAHQLEHDPQTLKALIRQCWQHDRSIGRLITLISEPLLLRILQRIEGLDLSRLLPVAEAMVLVAEPLLSLSSSAVSEFKGSNLLLANRLKWQFICRFMVQQRRLFELKSFVRLFAEFLWQHSQLHLPVDFYRQLEQGLTQQVHELGKNLVDSISELIIPMINAPQTQAKQELSESQQPPETSTEPPYDPYVDKYFEAIEMDSPMVQPGEQIRIENAGLVIAGAFIPMLFKRLNWLEDGQFIDLQSQERAVHLLQYMACSQTHTPEHELVLNKLLCGLQLAQPIVAGVNLTDDEKELSNQLIMTMNAHWGVSPNTSVDGFKQSFLQREGVLERGQDSWTLKVRYQAVDVLRQGKEIPWNFTLIRFSWTDEVIHVVWDKTTEQI